MASLLLKRSCNPSALRSMVSSSLGIATSSRSSTTVAVGSDVVSAAAPDASSQKSRIWDDGVSSKFSTTPVSDIFKDKKLVNFGLPGAHTRVGSLQHVPSYKNNIDKFKAKGIDSIVYGAINNPYVMNAQAWKLGPKDAVGFHSGAPKSDLLKDVSQPSDLSWGPSFTDRFFRIYHS